MSHKGKDRSLSSIGFRHSTLFQSNQPTWYTDKLSKTPPASHVSGKSIPDLESDQNLEAELLGASEKPQFSKYSIYNDDLKKLSESDKLDGKTIFRHITIGLINCTVLSTSMVGFASIIYKDEFFTKNGYFPEMLKLAFLSGAVHQFCFLMLSTLPFAVGQVQDAGLIFLSSMASKIVHNLIQREGIVFDDIITTVVFSLSGSTALLGVLLVLVGKFKLASLVQYLPLPVIGGYLAFIGLFCGESGLRLMTDNAKIENLEGLVYLADWETLSLALPGILAGLLLFYVAQKVNNNMALPGLLFSFPIIFYGMWFLTGGNLDSAREAGWLNEPADVPPFYTVTRFFNLAERTFHWDAVFPSIVPDFIAMFFIVSFGSCLDVAAVQFEMGKPLDYNVELHCVGVSNVVSGCLGGYTGSYIFSQTIFTLRNGVDTRIASWVVVFAELLIFVFPVDLLGILPRFFFGSVLLFVAYDLLVDWFILAYFKLRNAEYALVWLTFLGICSTNLEIGMGIGIVAASLNFAGSYARETSVTKLDPPPPNVLEPYISTIKNTSKKDVIYLKLQGFQFFGSSQKVISAIEQEVAKADFDFDMGLSSETTDSADEYSVEAVVLDCQDIISIDATAARGCFLTLVFLLAESSIELLLCGLKDDLVSLLLKNEVLRENNVKEEGEAKPFAKYFENTSQAQEYFHEHLSVSQRSFEPDEDSLLSSFPYGLGEVFKTHGSRRTLSKNEELIQEGGAANKIFVLLTGQLGFTNSTQKNAEAALGGIIGGLNFFSKKPFEFSLTAKDDADVLELSRDAFNVIEAESPSLSVNIRDYILEKLS